MADQKRNPTLAVRRRSSAPRAPGRFVVLFSLTQLLLLGCNLLAAQVESNLQPWPAQWITCAEAPERDGFLFRFRKVLELPQKPAHFLVHISADNQFLLHVNQQPVGTGPARGDLAHWRFETYDLAPYLRAGRNTLAATVWGFGTRSAYAQISDRAGFLLQGDGPSESAADTNETWQVEDDKGLQAPFPTPEVSDFYGAEPGERIEAQTLDWAWDSDPASPDHTSLASAPAIPARPRQWKNALAIDNAVRRGGQMQTTNWQLVPDPLPPMAMDLTSAGKVVRISGWEMPGGNLPSGFPDRAITVPAHSNVTVLLDVSHLTTGYPELTVSAGRGASIRQTYAEALIDDKGQKGNRNEIAGKHIIGLSDEFIPDGATRTFVPLAWRAWRYLQLDVSTADEPLELLLIEWRSPRSHGRHYAQPNHAGLYRVALCVDDTRATYSAMSRAGWEFDLMPVAVELDGTAVPMMWICFLSDPDGMPYELVERPRSAFRATTPPLSSAPTPPRACSPPTHS